RLRVPHPHLTSLAETPRAARGEALAVGGERHAVDQAGVYREGERLLPRPRVPHLDLAPARESIPRIRVTVPRRDPLAVAGDSPPRDLDSLRPDGDLLLSRLRVPDLHCPVPAPRGDTLPIGRKRHAADIAGMPLEGE